MVASARAGVGRVRPDFCFLTTPDLYTLFDGGPETRLIRAEIDSRMRRFDLAYNRDATFPFFLQRGRPAVPDGPPPHGAVSSKGSAPVAARSPELHGSSISTISINGDSGVVFLESATGQGPPSV